MARSKRFPSFRSFWRANSGATATEFALVGLPFFFILFAVLEIGLIFVVDSVLDNAVIETGRLVRTGQASAQSMTREQFLDRLCDRMIIFESSCRADGTTEIDVRVVPQFNVSLDDPADDGEFDDGETTYANGAPGDLILVRVWYHHPIITAFLAPGAQELASGQLILASSTAFRNEPA